MFGTHQPQTVASQSAVAVAFHPIDNGYRFRAAPHTPWLSVKDKAQAARLYMSLVMMDVIGPYQAPVLA